MANQTETVEVSPYRCDSLGHINVRAVHSDELTRCIALRECISLFRKNWFEIMQIDQFDPSRKFDPLGRGDLMASMNTELDVYVEFYDATVRGKTRLVDVNRDYIALNPMWSLAKTIDEAFAIQKDHEPLLVVKRGGDNFQPATVFGSNNADWAAWKLLAS